MNQTLKKFCMAMVMLMVFTVAAGQGGSAFAASQAQGTPTAPLAPGLTWNDLGQTSRNITLNIKGDSITLSGATYQAAEYFSTELPLEVSGFYSNEQLSNDGWTSDNSFETPEGQHQVFYHESGVYLAVDFVVCADDAGAKCVTVWLSEQASSAVVVPGKTVTETSVEPNATWGKIAPVNTATVTTPNSVTLSWKAYSPTPDKYSYCIKVNSECADNDPNWTGTFTNTSVGLSLSPGVKYYWQVKAITCGSCIPKKYVEADSGIWWNFTTISNKISGNAGVAGVTLTYVDNGTKTVTSDVNGNYSISPSYNWSGTVTPTKTGYTFSPVSRAYANVKTDQAAQNYTAIPIIYTITGTLGSGGAGALLNYTGSSTPVIASGTGAYTINVPYGWSGTVTPSKDCVNFSPASLVYPTITANQVNQNYTTNAVTGTISGNSHVISALMSYTGGSTTSDGAAAYSFNFSCPWSGTVTPSKAGYLFTPASRSYSGLKLSMTGQNFIATPSVQISGNAGSGTTISYAYANVSRTVTADGSGNYSLVVPTGWSGRLTATRSSTIFTPRFIDLVNVSVPQTGVNFTPSAGFNISGNVGVAGVPLSFTDGVAQTAISDGGGNYTLAVSSGFSGNVTPAKSGYTFLPANRSYTSVTSDQTGQTYTPNTNVSFLDVPDTYWAWQSVETLLANGITSGCTATNFCPTSPVTRDQMAVFLVRAKHGSAFIPPAATGVFADVPAGYWAAAWIEQLAADGITSGCTTTIPKNFCPATPVTRSQMAIFLLRAERGSSFAPPAARGIFADVPVGTWADAWIEQLSVEGVTNGCTGTSYCPSATINRDQVAVFLVKAFGLK